MNLKKVLATGLAATMALGVAAVPAAAGEDIVTLKWVTVGSGMPDNYDSWKATLDEYLGEKIGVNIEMEVIGWGDWDNRRSIIVTTNEPYDIIFGNGNNFVADVELGAVMDITDLLEENAPDLCEMIPEDYWKSASLNGSIYAVPTYKDSSLTNYMIWDKELVDEYDIDYENMTDLASLTDIFTTLKADKSDYPVYVKNDGLYYIFDVYDELGAGTDILGVRYDDETGKVCLTLEEEDIYSQLETIHEWYEAGIINTDASTLSEGRVYNMWRVAQGWPSAADTVWGPDMGKDVVVAQMGDTILSNDTVRGSLNMISANSQHPDKCLQFLNLINTDPYVRDMFYYGEEGVNYEYNEEGYVHRINTDWTMAGYTQATFFIVTVEENGNPLQWDEIKALNEQAVGSTMLGFTMDTSSVADQLANAQEIWLRYKPEILTGVVDPADAVPAMKAELMDAGFQDILDEAQRQVDEFLAAQGE